MIRTHNYNYQDSTLIISDNQGCFLAPSTGTLVSRAQNKIPPGIACLPLAWFYFMSRCTCHWTEFAWCTVNVSPQWAGNKITSQLNKRRAPDVRSAAFNTASCVQALVMEPSRPVAEGCLVC